MYCVLCGCTHLSLSKIASATAQPRQQLTVQQAQANLLHILQNLRIYINVITCFYEVEANIQFEIAGAVGCIS